MKSLKMFIPAWIPVISRAFSWKYPHRSNGFVRSFSLIPSTEDMFQMTLSALPSGKCAFMKVFIKSSPDSVQFQLFFSNSWEEPLSVFCNRYVSFTVLYCIRTALNYLLKLSFQLRKSPLPSDYHRPIRFLDFQGATLPGMHLH